MGTNYIAPIWRMPRNANKDKLSNYSIFFNGSTDYISIEDNILSGLSNFSISVWYNTDTLSGDRAILGAWSSGVTQMLLYWDDPLGWRFLMNNGTSTSAVVWGTATSINTWNHIVVTFDGTTLSFHHNNGTPVTNSGTGPVNTSASAWRIGVDTSSTRYWDGELSQFCLFDYALSTDQITYLYNLNNPMVIDGGEPIQYLPLGDNSNPNAPGSFPNISVGADSIFDFDGSNDYITIQDSDSLSFGDGANDSPFSISAWVNVDDTSINRIINKVGGSDAEWLFTTGTASRTLVLNLYSSGATTSGPNRGLAGSTSLNSYIGQWVHVACSYDGRGGNAAYDGIKLYFNGQLETVTTNISAGTTYTAMANGVAPVRIGSDIYFTNNYMNGKISNVQIWGTELSAPEVTTLYNNGQPLMTGTQPQESNLKAWYKLNQSANWEADTAGNWQIPDAVSLYPQSFDFDGSSDYIDIGQQDELKNITALSISLWFNYDSIATSADGLVGRDSSTRVDGNWYVALDSSNSIRFLLKTANGQDALNSSTISANKWYHTLCVWNGTTMKIYLNGDLSNSITLSNATGTLGSVSDIVAIGRRFDSSGFLNGNASNVALWNSDQSSEISNIYNNGVPATSYTNNPVAWYKLDNNEKFDGTNWSVENQKYPASYESALKFPGNFVSGTGMSFSPLTINATQANTYSAWVYPTGALDYWTMLMGDYSGSTSRIAPISLVKSGGSFWAIRSTQRSINTTANSIKSNTISNDELGKWHHIMVVVDNLDVSFYLNGQPHGTATFTNPWTSSTFNLFNIGNYSNWVAKGYMSNIAIWDSDQSTNIANIYNNGTPQNSYTVEPIAWWKLDNTTTGLNDIIGGKNGTLTGDITKVNTFVSKEAGESSGMTEQSLANNNVSVLNGESVSMNTTNLVTSNISRTQPYSNYSFNFDSASTDYFDLGGLQGTALQPSNTTLVSDGFSVSVWVNLDDTSTFRTFWQNDGLGNANYYGLIFLMNTGGQLNIGYNNGGAAGSGSRKNYITTAAQITSTGTWYHVVAIYKGIAVTPGLYVNGVEITAFNSPTGSATTLVYSSSAKGSIGIGRNAIQPMEGKISNCACFDRTLTQDEVLNIYNNGVPQDLQTASSFSNNIAAWWPMDGSNSYYDGTNWVVRDLENGNDGTGVNTGNVDDLVGNAPGSDANGTGINLAIADLKGNMYNSDKNAYSINMADYADGVTNPANSGRSTDTP